MGQACPETSVTVPVMSAVVLCAMTHGPAGSSKHPAKSEPAMPGGCVFLLLSAENVVSEIFHHPRPPKISLRIADYAMERGVVTQRSKACRVVVCR
jgi:hypothetical protein